MGSDMENAICTAILLIFLPSVCPIIPALACVVSRRWLLESAGKVHSGGQKTRNSRDGSIYLLCGMKVVSPALVPFQDDIFECPDCTLRGAYPLKRILDCADSRSVFGPTIASSVFRAAEVES